LLADGVLALRGLAISALVDATSQSAVPRLRERKRREQSRWP
jgi:hypothetical protein